jgi:hypothetical protein
MKAKNRVYYDQFTRCVCGHDFGHHDQSQPADPEEPHQCRLCECEAFMTKKQDIVQAHAEIAYDAIRLYE